MYQKLFNDTEVSFGTGLNKVRLNRKNCLRVIANIKAGQDKYATKEYYKRNLAKYENAARFMGWLK
jgi:hypothetical protein